MKQAAEDKAKERLGERRVNVVKADERGIWALVRGDGGTYKAKWTRTRGGLLMGECTCGCPTRNCWHLRALRMVWTGERP